MSTKIPHVASQGLSYRILNNDTIAITGVGDCEDTTLNIPDEIDGKIVSSIDSCAFQYNCDIVALTIPNTVISIGAAAFYGCKKLRRIHVSDLVYNIGQHAFAACEKLETIELGRIGQLEWFARDIFYCCDKITNIQITRG